VTLFIISVISLNKFHIIAGLVEKISREIVDIFFMSLKKIKWSSLLREMERAVSASYFLVEFNWDKIILKFL